MSWLSRPGFAVLGTLGVLAGAAAAWIADPPPPPEVSTFAPAEDLVRQVEVYLVDFEKALATPEEYDEEAIAKMTKDAHTLAVICQHLGLSDTPTKIQANAGAMLVASQQLATAKDHAEAKAAFDSLQQAHAGSGSADAPKPTWGKVGSLGQLMKQVTFVNNRLRRGVRGARFKTAADDTTQYAAVLAVIANASNYDTHEVKDPAEVDAWYDYCAQMREASGAVNAAIHAQDEAACTAALGKLEQSCNGCHEKFRIVTTETTAPE